MRVWTKFTPAQWLAKCKAEAEAEIALHGRVESQIAEWRSQGKKVTRIQDEIIVED